MQITGHKNSNIITSRGLTNADSLCIIADK